MSHKPMSMMYVRIINTEDFKCGLLGIVLTVICFIITHIAFNEFLNTSVYETEKNFILFWGISILIIIDGFFLLGTIGAFLSAIEETKRSYNDSGVLHEP